jgi:hypothetical protein
MFPNPRTTTALSIDVTELASATMTRARGTEAYRNLQPTLRQGPIELALDHAELLFGAFLDELILRLREDGLTDALTFVTKNPCTLTKLARAAGLRGATIFVRSEPSAPRKQVTPQRPTFESTAAASKRGAR